MLSLRRHPLLWLDLPKIQKILLGKEDLPNPGLLTCLSHSTSASAGMVARIRLASAT